MTDSIFELSPAHPLRPPLPEPSRERWQPLRLGLVELFHYDSEEFWFRDGHLLLRGNNGTGKSKVLSLTLPLLLDANLRPSRVEPDGDGGKRMAWNLLMGSYPRRIGYAWIEFGLREKDGGLRYLTLGVGLSAVAARTQVESWFFLLDAGSSDATRIGRDLWLTNEQRVVLTRERLDHAIEGRGQVFDTAASYRRAVDERLFHLGTRRYDALMDTLIQLRQPQLSKKPDEAGLSHALTEALPPMPTDLLTDVAEALNQLEEDRDQLNELKELLRAVERFDGRYRVYAGMLTRRQARELRQAQTDFDNASHARNQAHAASTEARHHEEQAHEASDEAELALVAQRARLETLQSDPINQDANRLESAEKNDKRRQEAVDKATRDTAESRARAEREAETGRRVAERARLAAQDLLAAREDSAGHAESAGLNPSFDENPLILQTPVVIANLTAREIDAALSALRAIAQAKVEQLTLLRRRHEQLLTASRALTQRQEFEADRKFELQQAAESRGAADIEFEQAAQALVANWTEYCAALVQLRFSADAALDALIHWVALAAGDNPARQALQASLQQANVRHANRQVELAGMSDALNHEREQLETERQQLRDGQDAAPPRSYTRDAAARHTLPGAPLWQLVDFQDHVASGHRAGVEAALEASGLLDAWVTPDGSILSGEDRELPWLDSQWMTRPTAVGASLNDWLRVDAHVDVGIAAVAIERLLAGVACNAHAPPDESAEAWIAADGRFRLGPLTGAWQKSDAVYIGQTARAVARQQRLNEIAARMQALEGDAKQVKQYKADLDEDRRTAEREWLAAPSDRALHQAALNTGLRESELQAARKKLEHAGVLCRDAEQAEASARTTLYQDATDMGLPSDMDALQPIETALRNFDHSHFRLARTVQEWRHAHPEVLTQQGREQEALALLRTDEEVLESARFEAEESHASVKALRDTVGAKVEELRERLAETRNAVREAERQQKSAAETWRKTIEARALANEKETTADNTLRERSEARGTAIERLQRFAQSSLLSSALPEIELPDLRTAWTIDPALTLARRIEQALAELQDTDNAWSRTQRQITEDLQELQRALSALGHQAPAEPNDWGFAVQIIFHNRPERPDQLAARLMDDVAQRSELLSAKESAVLENYLQAEIAAEVQRLLRSADKQVQAINKELQKRPTSTGVRYRLLWQPLGEDEGAPVGLDAARERLLNTSTDMWSAEDRRAIGNMLQQRIAAERERADAELGRLAGDSAGSLVDQLARALDYRRWHRFRVERSQDGQWRKLSGPASSGERALGLTVPLFAAIASFYSQGSNPQAPRLMLLDEAFAGIDDAARAHCMGLIREFDLDFVITSEREWACYAELPGVSICQLQRREGIDAIFVSRWTWDGRAKRPDSDPDRRFPSP